MREWAVQVTHGVPDGSVLATPEFLAFTDPAIVQVEICILDKSYRIADWDSDRRAFVLAEKEPP